jgi:hypothetical protein
VNSLKSAAELTAKRDGDAARLKIDGLKTAAQITEQKRSSNQKMAIDALKTAATLEAQAKNKSDDRSHRSAKAEKPQRFAEGGKVGEKENLSDDYDYAGYDRAVAQGLIESRAGEEAHYPDTFKLPNHITFSEQSKYSNEKTPGGRWMETEGGRYYFHPSEHNLKNTSPDAMAEYFKNYEKKGTSVVLPDGRIIEGSR